VHRPINPIGFSLIVVTAIPLRYSDLASKNLRPSRCSES
jgi:hypothetical protein